MHTRPRIISLAFFAVLSVAPTANAQYIRVGNPGAIPTAGLNAPTLLSSTRVPYTEDARTHAIEGTVTIEALIDEDGRVKSSRVLKRLGFGLDEAAMESVREWTFSPATQDGVPVALTAQVDVEFNLRNTNALRMGAGMTPPKALSQGFPHFTEEARRAKIPDAKVILQVVVKTDGSVDVVRVVQGFAFGMTDSAIKALKQYRFNPGRKDGQDVDVALDFEFNFHLH